MIDTQNRMVKRLMPAKRARRFPRGSSGLAAFFAVLAGLRAPARLRESVRVLRRIQAGAAAEQTPAPREDVSYRPRGRSRHGDLYRIGAPLAGLVLIPGATRLGKDDPRLVAFAQALALARFEVLVPDLPGLTELRVRADHADIIADAILALSQHRAARGSATVGVTAICYATGPAMMALLDPDVRGAAQFMLSIGGYWSMEAVIAFITTGCHRDPRDGVRHHRPPDEYGKWVFAISNANVLADDRDRELLEAMAHRRLADGTADVSDLAAGLGAAGRSVYAVLENRDPERVRSLVAALPQPVLEETARLDPSRRDFSDLDMRFTLIHGSDDAVIPETQSMALAGALPRAELFILRSIQHVDPGPAGLGDRLKLLAAVHGLLRYRDTVRRPTVAEAASPLHTAGRTPRPG